MVFGQLENQDAESFKRLAAYRTPPSGASTPARSLTQEQARDLVIHCVAREWIYLEKPVAFDKAGKPSYPKAGDKVKVSLTMNGVVLVPNNTAARGWRLTGPLDLRMVVLLCRLTKYLKEKWGAYEIYWGGLGVGRSSTDRHGQGFAMDFHGAATSKGKFDVMRDWGQKKVTLADGKQAGQWPPNAKSVSYRLDPKSQAGAFFQDVYAFLAGQATDQGIAPTTIGQRTAICHPDHPSIGLRNTHKDHIHLEIDR